MKNHEDREDRNEDAESHRARFLSGKFRADLENSSKLINRLTGQHSYEAIAQKCELVGPLVLRDEIGDDLPPIFSSNAYELTDDLRDALLVLARKDIATTNAYATIVFREVYAIRKRVNVMSWLMALIAFANLAVLFAVFFGYS